MSFGCWVVSDGGDVRKGLFLRVFLISAELFQNVFCWILRFFGVFESAICGFLRENGLFCGDFFPVGWRVFPELVVGVGLVLGLGSSVLDAGGAVSGGGNGDRAGVR